MFNYFYILNCFISIGYLSNWQFEVKCKKIELKVNESCVQ
ncbi:hypothetical protein PPRY_a2389 [Pseudoalteromonas prydzensis ACAM 620]|nr:hypothetical protein [Pseudoalteromonas prydzensis ACAM 620]